MSASADVFAVSAVTVARRSPYRVNSASKRRCDSFDQHLETLFDTKVLGVTVTVERIDMSDDEQIIAICRRGRSLLAIPILDLVFSDDHCPAHVHAPHRGEGWIARLEVLVRERRSEVHEHRACQGHSATTRSKPTLERY